MVLVSRLRQSLFCLVSLLLLLGPGAVAGPAAGHGPLDSRDSRQHRASQSGSRNANRTYDVVNVTLTDRTPFVGQPIHVHATLKNPASRPHTARVALHADGRPVARRRVRLPAEGTRTVSFEFTPHADGTWRLAVDDHDVGTVRVQPRLSRGTPIPALLVTAVLLAVTTAGTAVRYFGRE